MTSSGHFGQAVCIATNKVSSFVLDHLSSPFFPWQVEHVVPVSRPVLYPLFLSDPCTKKLFFEILHLGFLQRRNT